MFKAFALSQGPESAPHEPDIFPLAKLAIDIAFQPIVETVSGETYGHESLMRGFDQLGFSGPHDLLDMFALNGDLQRLEYLLTSRALAKFTTLPGYQSKTLFLNLDNRLLPQGAELMERLLPHLERNKVPPSSICFELSERSDATRTADLSAVLSRARKLGFRLALDDFGTGAAEWRLLNDFEIDYLKIDRHFISGIDTNARSRHLVKSVAEACHVLGVRVIGEGVETESEFIVAKELGLDFVQGFFIAEPSTSVSNVAPSYSYLREVGRRNRTTASLDELLIRKTVQELPTVYENDPVDTLFDLFRSNPMQSYFPVLNANGEPRGIVHEHRLKQVIYQPFGRDLLHNKNYGRTVSSFVEPCPVVNLDTKAEKMMSLFSAGERTACVILTENLTYAGVISAEALIKIISEKQIKAAQDQNPLSGLPGNQAISEFMQQAAIDGDTCRHFCYCDFDNFKPFNDHYGFQRGDEAIALFARLLKRYFFSAGTIVGHVGGDDFFIGLQGWDRAELSEIMSRLLSDFDMDIQQFYDTEDRERGYIEGADRDGNARRFGFVRCSIGVLEIPQGAMFGDTRHIVSEIAELKKKAKKSDSGLVFNCVGSNGLVDIKSSEAGACC
ncbi:EAL domain-containing protein [Rhizobium sp. L1K21]|uniref:bifunctional diguanylate cyclase/phosphodiesterase n=1 Tax=Rhizobium sp. L1K21 TaxID=2954933 RepID=UPI00209201D6|nr:GGDEF domain-containing protein [Rhizobium sp. L1K21]